MPTKPDDRYLRPDWFTKHVWNRLVRRLTRLGVSLAGSRVLVVPGRRTGVPRSTVVNLLELDGTRYLVAPRGIAEWVRNLRAADGHGELHLGRRHVPFVADEVADADKLPVLRAYLDRWGWEVGKFFDGVTRDAPDGDLARIAPGFPVFLLRST